MKLKRLWITLVSLLTLLIFKIDINSASITQSDSQSAQITEHNTVTDPSVRIHITQPKHHNPVISQTKINQYLHQMRAQTLNDIQSDRSLHGVAPIGIDSKLNHLAQIRAKQIAQRFNHYDRKGYPYTTDDAKSVHLPRGFRGSENIASTGLGNCITIGDPKTYHNHNGRQMAAMANDAMMNHDQLEANGHRKNILDPENTLVGIGTTYNHAKHEFYLAEDFGNHSPESSEDINPVSPGKINRSEFRIMMKELNKKVHLMFNYSLSFIKQWF